MTTGILRCSIKKEKLNKDFKKSHSADSEKNFKYIEKKLNKLIKVVERDYYRG